MRSTFINTLLEQAKMDDRIFIVTPDLGFSVFEEFASLFPDRFLNVGIAEQNAVGIAAGLALSGKIVYVYSIIPFVTMRCFEQIRVDLAYMNTNVRLVGAGAGFTYGPAGATHHAIEDIAIMRSLPNMTVLCPGDPVELKCLLNESFHHQGPIYFRLGRNGESVIHSKQTAIKIGDVIEITNGKDAALLVTSNMLEEGKKWAEEQAQKGHSPMLVSIPTIKPIDADAIKRIIDRNIPIRTLEEHNIIGGLGSAVAEIIAEYGKPVDFKRIGVQDQYSHYVGSHMFIREKFGLRGSAAITDSLRNKNRESGQ